MVLKFARIYAPFGMYQHLRVALEQRFQPSYLFRSYYGGFDASTCFNLHGFMPPLASTIQYATFSEKKSARIYAPFGTHYTVVLKSYFTSLLVILLNNL